MSVFSLEKLEGDVFKLVLSKKIYDKMAVLNASYNQSDIAFFKIDSIDEKNVAVFIKFKNTVQDNEAQVFADNFLNDIIDYQIRLDLDVRTNHIKQVIFDKAFSALKVSK
ncbi:MAG: His-Xaa-Ser system protein HxsD [Acidaminococcaceae bacterium]|nr:His-Xaa-Ser system protein HxsD [Acidaminococcaceae bacterium]